MAKVKVEYKVVLNAGYERTKYKQKTIEIDLPKNEYGFTLVKTLSENIYTYLKENIVSKIPDVSYFEVIWHQVIN
jgi:hypothetical protein